MKPINLEEFRSGVRGRPYNALIQHHLKRQNHNDRNRGIQGTIAMIAPVLHPDLEVYIDRWNLRAYDADFWRKDCADVLDEMIEDAREVIRAAGQLEDDETLFNFFQIVTLNFAAMASEQPKLRKLAGIKKGWFS